MLTNMQFINELGITYINLNRYELSILSLDFSLFVHVMQKWRVCNLHM